MAVSIFSPDLVAYSYSPTAFLMALGVSIILQSIERFIEPSHIKEPILVLAIGAAGLGSNVIMATILGGERLNLLVTSLIPISGHSHGSDPIITQVGTTASRQDHAEHAHARHDKKGTKHKHDLNILGVLIHILGDAINNVAVSKLPSPLDPSRLN